jgi:hypothetical protein
VRTILVRTKEWPPPSSLSVVKFNDNLPAEVIPLLQPPNHMLRTLPNYYASFRVAHARNGSAHAWTGSAHASKKSSDRLGAVSLHLSSLHQYAQPLNRSTAIDNSLQVFCLLLAYMNAYMNSTDELRALQWVGLLG